MALVHFLDINNWYYKEADYERQKETLLIVDDSKFQRTYCLHHYLLRQ